MSAQAPNAEVGEDAASRVSAVFAGSLLQVVRMRERRLSAGQLLTETGRLLASAPPQLSLARVAARLAHELGGGCLVLSADDEGFDRQNWGHDGVVTPIVAALDPKGEAARAGMEIDDMVLSINGQTGLSNTEAAAMLRDLSGTIVLVVRKCTWLGIGVGEEEQEVSSPTPMTPRSAARKLV